MNGADDWGAAEAAARAALATDATTARLSGAPFTPIDVSLSNFAWSADAGQHKRFVRLARLGTEDFGADLAAEARILHQVGEAGISPRVVRCDPAQRLLVTHWIEPAGEPSSFAEPAVIVTVGQALARLHALRVPSDLRVVRFDAQARLLAASLPELLGRAAGCSGGTILSPAPAAISIRSRAILRGCANGE